MTDPPPLKKKEKKKVKSFFPTHLHAYPSHLHASIMIYIHNVQFQIFSLEMILPQKLTLNTFYSYAHGYGITL